MPKRRSPRLAAAGVAGAHGKVEVRGDHGMLIDVAIAIGAPADAQPSAGAVAAQMKAERARADAAELQLRRLRGDDGALAGMAAEEAQKLLGEASQGVERITRFIAQQQRAKGR